MNCTKCGKEIRVGDTYCSGCGQKIVSPSANATTSAPEKKNGGCLIWLVIIAAIVIFLSNRGGKTEKHEPESKVPAVTQPVAMENYGHPLEPADGDVLEDSDYPDGTPRRRVSGSTDKYITDYRRDGTLLRDVTLYYSNGGYSAKRVTNYDEYGNPTDTTERMADGQLWLHLYYENTYDPEGRPAYLLEFNRVGCVLYERIYMYNDDGSYSMSWNEYRGSVYEYDFETDPTGETFLFAYGYTTFDADGNVIDQMIYDVPVDER